MSNICQIMVKYEFVIELTNMSLNELNDVDSNRSSDQRPMAASLKQQQSTSSDIYCAFYWTTRWLKSILSHFLFLNSHSFSSDIHSAFVESSDDSIPYILTFFFFTFTLFIQSKFIELFIKQPADLKFVKKKKLYNWIFGTQILHTKKHVNCSYFC